MVRGAAAGATWSLLWPPDGYGSILEGMDWLSNILPGLIMLGMGVTVVVLLAGITSMFVGGKFNARYSNKLMTARVAFQALTIALVMLVLFLTGR